MEEQPKVPPDSETGPRPVFTQTTAQVLATYASDMDQGLSEATAKRRLAKNGPNELSAHVTPNGSFFSDSLIMSLSIFCCLPL